MNGVASDAKRCSGVSSTTTARGATSCGWLEPAPDLEENHQEDERDNLRSDSEHEEARRRLDVGDHEREVLTEESGDERERHENRCDDGQLFDHFVLAIGDER